MHEAAVFLLCALVVYFVWRDLVEILIAWYSGAEPPLTAVDKAWLWSRSAVAVAAVGVAIATL